MPFYEKGDVRIHYEEAGSGFPVLMTPGGGLNSVMANWKSATAPFNALTDFSDEFRIITMDQRNAPSGESTGPIPDDGDGWSGFYEDQIGLMDHLGIRQFAFLGCCIGGSFVMRMIREVPDRIVAGILCQPIGHRPENPGVMYITGQTGWAPVMLERHPEVDQRHINRYLRDLYWEIPDLVYSVSRDFITKSQTPILVMPDDTPAHGLEAALEVARISPNAEQTIYPWKDTAEQKAQAADHVRRFLRAHIPATAK
ncbi:MAG TPA: alpha/beta hydrolase [Fimbriimonadaceae bacterium]|nr:alpha/beta hydrolase [Fimbriimonadaceae bacterium]